MMFRVTIALVALVAGFCAADWDVYKEVHNKVYDASEDQTRQAIFEKNVARINAHNLRHDLGLTTYRMGLNKFTDVTPEEFRKYRGFRMSNSTLKRSTSTLGDEEVNEKALPSSVDWRKKGFVTPVKNQGQCGSCWSFSATGSLEGQHFKKTGKLVSLSEQNLVDCSGKFGNEGCDGGLMDSAFEYVKANGGLDTEASYPYEAMDEKCNFNKKTVGATVTGYVDVKSGSEAALQKAVATVGPISVAIDASGDFQLYSGGIYDEPDCSPTQLDHGVLAVGYGTEKGKKFWIVKNSWGEDWGEKGYIRMSRNRNNQCGIATQASYPRV